MPGCGSSAVAPSENGCRASDYPTSSGSADQLTPPRLRIDQLGRIHGALRPDQALDVVAHIPDVDIHPRQHPVAGVEPKSDEFSAVNVATEYDAVICRSVPRILHP